MKNTRIKACVEVRYSCFLISSEIVLVYLQYDTCADMSITKQSKIPLTLFKAGLNDGTVHTMSDYRISLQHPSLVGRSIVISFASVLHCEQIRLLSGR